MKFNFPFYYIDHYRSLNQPINKLQMIIKKNNKLKRANNKNKVIKPR